MDLEQMSLKEKMSLILTMLKIYVLKILPKLDLNENRVLKLLIIFCIIFSCQIFLYSYFTGWYSTPSNIDGLITEMHGMIIEVFILTIVLHKILNIRENIKTRQPRMYIYSKIFEEIEHCILTLYPDLRLKTEKIYVYFLNNPVHARKYDKFFDYKHSELEDEEIYKIVYAGKEYIHFFDSYVKPKNILIRKLKKILLQNLILIEPKIIYAIQDLLEWNKFLEEKEKEINKDNCDFEKERNYIKSVTFFIFINKLQYIRFLLLNKADKVLSNEEEQSKRESYRKELEKLKIT